VSQGPLSDGFVPTAPAASLINSRAIVPVTSDRGLCGALNALISRRVRGIYTEQAEAKGPALGLIPIGVKGKSGAQFLSRSRCFVAVVFDD
jgi:F0F1-type ATP synthase gamma subunit